MRANQKFLRIILKPLVRLCLRLGIRFQDFAGGAEQVFIAEAVKELARSGGSVSVSKVSAMTGLRRPNIKKFLNSSKNERKAHSSDLITRILGLWQKHKNFTTAQKKPRALKFEGINSEFARLVNLISSDLNHHTVLHELERLKFVRRDKNKVHLEFPAYIVSDEPEEAMRMLAQDFGNLSSAVLENVFDSPNEANLHARTEYDNIPVEYLPKIRRWFLASGQKLHAQARSFLSQFDRDLSPKLPPSKGRAKVVIGTFSFADRIEGSKSEDVEGEDHDKK